GDIPKVKRPPSGSRKGCNETPAKRREKIISLYKSGMNQAEVCRKMKAGKNTVRRILKEEGLLK
ncbi:helix-turn-helix domain-containing protein, partial [Methanocorpusculum sp.]|nr:helix-turn-helix domain-containing protein [Methanocorpusculum sp.]